MVVLIKEKGKKVLSYYYIIIIIISSSDSFLAEGIFQLMLILQIDFILRYTPAAHME